MRGLFLYPYRVAELAGEFPQVRALRAVVTQRDFCDELVLETELNQGSKRRRTWLLPWRLGRRNRCGCGRGWFSDRL